MSQFRLARISLLLAAIGLNAAPVFLTSAHAQDKAAAPAAGAKKEEQIRPEMYKLIEPTKIKEMIAAKKFADVQAAITAAEAVPNHTPYEDYVIGRMKVALGYASNNEKMVADSLESTINSGFLEKKELEDFTITLANSYYTAKNYPKAIEWYKRYQKDSATPEKVAVSLNRAYFFGGDVATAKTELDKSIAAAEAAGKPPTEEDLRLLAGVYEKTKDKDGYAKVMEKLVTYYPTPEFWSDMLRRLQNKPGFNDRVQIDYYRLQAVATTEMSADQYVEYAERALLAASFAEAKKVVDKGYATNVLGQGSDAAKHKSLRDRVNKNAADDAKSIDAGEAGALKAKTGLPLVNLGFTYVTMDQFDKGIGLMEKGIAKGGLKNEKESQLRLGEAYALAGRKADALKVFESLKGAPDTVGDLARYWIMYVNGPKGTPAAKTN
ncbi:tetratricopeptide repeat protein [Massilia sp. CF038]|uniref:tetratricopeptide repeat protein n=1 Tax=Massilia sp. CF038 TaxID=1881045 RepID=UPI0009148943|nr:tetratricopeptide repeat protein [Massilia sp. CF038]SHH17051.1 hypothetical protein SAMN05428948_3134 [Massilia sp. CF038]